MSAPDESAPAPKRGPGRPKKVEGPSPPRPRPQKSQRTLRSVGKGASPEARKVAAAIFEVLGGVRTTTDAAQVLGCSLQRYYQLEARAVEGLLSACEPVRRGPGLSPRREAEALGKRCSRLERELGRQQALVRAAHRLAGVQPVSPAKPRAGKRPRRPTARALVAASVLRSPEATVTPPSAPGSP